MKKILIVNTLYYPDHVGGAELSVQSIAEGIKKHFIVTIMTVATDNIYREEIINGIRIFRIPTFGFKYGNYPKNKLLKLFWHILHNYNPIKDRFIKRVLKKISPEIIHTHNLLGLSTIIWKYAKENKIPILHTLRDRGLICPWHMYRNHKLCLKQSKFCYSYTLIRRIHTKYVDYLIGISNDILNNYIIEGYFKWRKEMYLIGNGINEISISQREINMPFTFGYLGAYTFEKGLDILVKAFNELTDIPLLVGGDFTRGHADQILKLNRNDQVKFLGKVEPSDFFSRINVLIVPSSFREPFGRVVIEAFSAGVPVIASDHGAFPEIIKNGITGWFFEPGNIVDLRDKIFMVKNMERKTLDNVILACIEEFRSNYTLNSMIKKHLEIYRTI